jgi:hypothetical protein
LRPAADRGSQEWLAEKLRMSSAANVSQQLRRLDKKAALGELAEKMKQFLGQAHPTELKGKLPTAKQLADVVWDGLH